jgi:4-amino-4-deoxy-L-arabinose transferase-like glycosyltransferase
LTFNNVKKLDEISLVHDKPLLTVLTIALVLRLLVMWFYPDQHFPDAQAYITIGREIFSGNIVTNNIYMPLYPILSFITGGGQIQILTDIFISVGSVWLIFSLSLTVFKDRLAALLSAFIGGLYPHFLFYSVSGLTEIFYTFLILLSFLLFYKKNIVLGIIISIFALLVRPSLDFLNPIMVVIFIIFVHNLDWKKASKYLGIYFLAYFVIMSPWWIHQYQKYDSFVRLNLGDGVVLYAGNNPLNISGGGITGVDVDESRFEGITDPVLRNNAQKDAAIEYIINNPGRFVKMSGVKFWRFWRLWPYTQEYSQWYIVVTSILSYGLVLFMAIGFIIRCSKKYFREISPIFALFGYLTLVHMVTIGSVRYRFPLEPYLIIFAGYFFIDIIKNNQWVVNISAKYLE